MARSEATYPDDLYLFAVYRGEVQRVKVRKRTPKTFVLEERAGLGFNCRARIEAQDVDRQGENPGCVSTTEAGALALHKMRAEKALEHAQAEAAEARRRIQWAEAKLDLLRLEAGDE